MDADIVDALDRICAENKDIYFTPKIVRRKTLSVIKRYCQDYIDLMDLESDAKNTKQGQLLQRSQIEGFAQVFKLLGLYYPREDIVKAYQNLQAGTRDSVAYAIELMDNTLSKEMKVIVMPLIEDLSPAARQREFEKILKILQ